MDNGIIGVLQFAIDGVTDQQNALANNIANAQTPDFTAQDVSFQHSLQSAIAASGPSTAEITVENDPAAPNTAGNNVDLNTELVDSEQATLQYQSIDESLNAQFRLISGSAGGSFT